MLNKIKNKIESQLSKFTLQIDKSYSLGKLSPLLLSSIKDFLLRDGKRIRPILFVIGYLGFAKKQAPNLYTSALAIELLHDFMLVHDDIIDKSDTRRGKPSMHKLLNNYLKRYKNVKFNGQDLAIVVGDVIYAMSIDAFLSINEEPLRKERALRNFLKAAMYTGSGEFIELIGGLTSIKKTTKNDIYKIYDYKTAHYTFACPLSTGAMLAGANDTQVKKLFDYGIYLGRAFQIKDDILGIFGDEKKIGKSTLSDLQEAKQTLIIWYTYNNSNKSTKHLIEQTFAKKRVTKNDLLSIQKAMAGSGALAYAKNEISRFAEKANSLMTSSSIKSKYKNFLCSYAKKSFGANG